MNKLALFYILTFTVISHSQNKNYFDNTFLIQSSKISSIENSNFNFEYKNFIFIPFNKKYKINIRKVKRKNKNHEKLIHFLKKKGSIYDLILVDQSIDRKLLNFLSKKNSEVIDRNNFICLNNFGLLYQNDLKIYKLDFIGQIETINIDDYYIETSESIHSDFSEISLKNSDEPKIISKVVNKKRVYVTNRNKDIDALFIYNILCNQIIKLVN